MFTPSTSSMDPDALPPSHAPPPTKILVLISGSGTNLQALIDSTTTGLLPNTSITRVISNKKSAHGLIRAQKASIPTSYHNLIAGKYLKSGETDQEVIRRGRERYDADLAELILRGGEGEVRPDLVVCAGWMHILAPSFLDPLDREGVRVINLHPALPGMYDGVGAIKRAWDDFQAGKLENNRTGVMIHYVISQVDRGEPIIVREVDCSEMKSVEELEEYMHDVEHQLIVEGTGLAIVRLWEERRKAAEAKK